MCTFSLQKGWHSLVAMLLIDPGTFLLEIITKNDVMLFNKQTLINHVNPKNRAQHHGVPPTLNWDLLHG